MIYYELFIHKSNLKANNSIGDFMNFIEKVWKDLPVCVKMSNIFKNKHIFGSGKMKYSFQTKKTGDGINCCVISAEGFKTACASISFIMPLGDKASLYALVPNVLTRSSENYPDITSIEQKLALLYGADIAVDISKTGENQVIKLAVGCIDDRFAIDDEKITDECCKLLFELVFKPRLVNGAFPEEDVESEKRLLCERLASEESDKRIYAKNRCEEIMCAEEAYGINRYGTAEDIKSATPESVYEAYKQMLSEAKIALCLSGGNFTDAENMLMQYIEGVSRDASLNDTLFVEAAEDVQYKKEKEAVKQGKLVMGFRLGMKNANDNYAARRVMVDLFGGNPHSKLFTVVREKMSLCYYCSARMIRAKGIMFVQSGIESYNEEKAREAILAQLDAIKNGEFSDEDMDASVKALEDGFKSVSDSPEALDSWFMSQAISEEYKYPEEFIEEFKKVTREDIISVAKAVTLDTVFMLEGTLTGGENDE